MTPPQEQADARHPEHDRDRVDAEADRGEPPPRDAVADRPERVVAEDATALVEARVGQQASEDEAGECDEEEAEDLPTGGLCRGALALFDVPGARFLESLPRPNYLSLQSPGL